MMRTHTDTPSSPMQRAPDRVAKSRGDTRVSKLSQGASGSQSTQKLARLQGAAEAWALANGPSRAPPLQRMTIAYTAADMGHGVALANFGDQVVQTVLYQRASIPQNVKNTVDGFGDCPAAGTYHHHVGHATIRDHLLDLCENTSRSEIVDQLDVRLDLIGVDSATFGVAPLSSIAAFNAWLDSAFVAFCDMPANIFRGPHAGGEPDYPTAPSPALTARLTEARQLLNDVDMM